MIKTRVTMVTLRHPPPNLQRHQNRSKAKTPQVQLTNPELQIDSRRCVRCRLGRVAGEAEGDQWVSRLVFYERLQCRNLAERLWGLQRWLKSCSSSRQSLHRPQTRLCNPPHPGGQEGLSFGFIYGRSWFLW